MDLSIIIPILVGSLGIIQASLNKEVANSMGLAQMSAFANLMTFLFSVVFFLVIKMSPDLLGGSFQIKTNWTFKWWYLIPSAFGFFVVIGLPYSFMSIGALKVTLTLIVAQVVTSILWDYFADGIGLSPMKTLGVVLACVGVIIVHINK